MSKDVKHISQYRSTIQYYIINNYDIGMNNIGFEPMI